MFVLMYVGPFMFFEKPFNPVTQPERDADGNPTNRMVLDTICFYSFVLMNLFNQFNCRLLDTDFEKGKKNYNIFTNSLFRTPLFWIVISVEFLLTSWMVLLGSDELGSALLGTAAIN